MKRRFAFAFLVVVAPGELVAQRARPCNIAWESLDTLTSMFSMRNALTGGYTTYYSGRVRARCQGTGMSITADSAEYLEDSRLLTLVGRAQYKEDSTTIDADLIRYTESDQRIDAEGNVRARTPTGSVLTTKQVRYFRPQPPGRMSARAHAFGDVILVQRDSASVHDTLATTILAERLYMERDSVFFAAGGVTITRTDLIAKSDSAESDVGKRKSRLISVSPGVTGLPSIKGRGARAFAVEGNLIDVFGRQQQADSVHAMGKAVAVSDSLRLDADTIRMKTNGTQIDRVLAWGSGGARATTPDRDVRARHLDLSMPGQRLRTLIAIGAARVDTRPDSTIRSTERDWIAGDTLVATFDDSVRVTPNTQPALKLLVARGMPAQAFYQMPPRNRTDTLPTINYVTGKRIDATFTGGAVKDVKVFEQVIGLNLSPLGRDTTTTPVRRVPPPGARR